MSKTSKVISISGGMLQQPKPHDIDSAGDDIDRLILQDQIDKLPAPAKELYKAGQETNTALKRLGPALTALLTNTQGLMAQMLITVTQAQTQAQPGQETCRHHVNDFAPYSATVTEAIAAAKDLEETSALFVSDSVRNIFHRYLANLETAWGRLLIAAKSRVDADTWSSFQEAIPPFVTAYNKFPEVIITGMQREMAEMQREMEEQLEELETFDEFCL